jgi:hypothetical protein
MLETAQWTSGSGLDVVAGDGASWIDAEVAGCALGDKRLCNRRRQLLRMSRCPQRGQSGPAVPAPSYLSNT